MKALVVTADPDRRKQLQRLLRACGIAYAWRKTVTTAARDLAALAPDLVLLAGEAAWADGLKARARSPYVLAVLDDEDEAEAALAAGADDCAVPESLPLRLRVLQRRLAAEPDGTVNGPQQAYFRQLFEHSPEAIVLIDADGRVVEANEAFGRLFGFALDELSGRNLDDLVAPPELRDEAHALSREVLAGEIQQTETVRRRKDGALVYVRILGFPIELDNGQVGVFGIYHDISRDKELERERERLLAELETLALHDPLTGLHNRHHLDQLLTQELDRAHRYGHPLTLLLLDVDGFKQVNDQLGHVRGDAVLREVGRVIQDTVRTSDIPFRYGGDEFLILLTETNGQAVHAVERLKQAFDTWKRGAGLDLPLGLSVGRVTWQPGDARTPEDLLREADRQLYEEKRGKDVARMQRQLSSASRQVRFQTAFLDSVSELIVATDLDGEVIYANQAFARWCGRAPDALVGVPLEEAVPSFAGVVRRAREGDFAPQQLQQRAGNAAQTVLVNPSELRNARGTPYALVYLGSDVTELEQLNRRLRRTQRFLERLNAETRLEPILQLLLEETVELVPHADSGSALLYDEAADELAFVAAVGWDLDALKRIRIKPELNIQHVKYGDEPAIIRDDLVAFQRAHWPPERVRAIGEVGLPAAFLSVPIKPEGRLVGYFNLNNRDESDAFDEDDLALAVSMRPQIELALKRARDREALQERQQRLSQVFQLGQELASLTAVEAIVRHAAAWTGARYGYERVGIALAEDEGFRIVASEGTPSAGSHLGQRFPLDESRFLVARAMRRRELICLDDVRAAEAYFAADPDTRSELVAPIALGDALIGALNLESSTPAAFGEQDRELASFVAGQLAVAISNVQRGQALHASEQRYRALFEFAPDGISLLDLEGRHLDANPAMLDLLGYSAEEFRALSYRDIIAPEDQDDTVQRLDRMRRGAAFLKPYRKRVLRKDGARVPVEFTVAPVPDERGELAFVLSVARDLREVVRLEGELSKSEQRFRAMFEGSPDAVFVESMDGVVRDVNPAACRLHGMTRAQLIGMHARQLVPPERRDQVADDVERFGANRERGIESHSLTADGRSVPVEIRAGTIDYDGEPALLLHVRDVSARVRDEAALRESEQRFRHVFHHASSGMALVDPEGCILDANENFLALYGYSLDELGGLTARDLVHPDDLPETLALHDELLAGKRDGYQAEKRYVRKDGEVFWGYLAVSAIRDEDGRLRYTIPMVRDVTARVRAEAERARLLARVQQQHLLAETLSEVTLALTARTDPEAVLDEVLNQAQRLVPFRSANIALVERGALRVVRAQGYDAFGAGEWIDGLVQPLAEMGATGAAVQSGQPLVVEDTAAQAGWAVYEPTRWIRSHAAVPICSGERVLGLLRLDSDEPGRFSAEDAGRLSPLANAAAVALENARQHEQVRHELAERAAAERALRASEEKYRDLVENINDVIFTVDAQGVVTYISPVITAYSGYRPEEVVGQPFQRFVHPDDLPGLLDSFQRTLAGEANPFEYRLIDKDGSPRWVRSTSRPAYEGGELAGVRGAFTDVSERKRAEAKRAELREQLERTAIDTAALLARVIDERDPYTAEHSKRLAHFATALAARFGLDEAARHQLHYAALLHDVGKVGVPEHILHKTGPLDAQEWDTMKEHVRLGVELIQSIRPLGHAARIVEQHHERWDGTGYPHGLKGEDILLEARILSTVDAFDAMTTDRPYRAALSFKQAREELRRYAGRCWDPEVVEAFLALWGQRER